MNDFLLQSQRRWLMDNGIAFTMEGERLVALGDIRLSGRQMEDMPDFSGMAVAGDFLIDSNRIETLAGCPDEVRGSFFCNNNPLPSLVGGPGIVRGNYYCQGCGLISLKGAPSVVGGSFNASYNALKSLIGGPCKTGGFFFADRNALETLRGAPETVGGAFSCDYNKLFSLRHGPRVVNGQYYCVNNRLRTMGGFPRVFHEAVWCFGNPLLSLAGVSRGFVEIISDHGEYYSMDEIPEHLRHPIYLPEDWREPVAALLAGGSGVVERLREPDDDYGSTMLHAAAGAGMFGAARQAALDAKEKFRAGDFGPDVVAEILRHGQATDMLDPALFENGVHDVVAVWEHVPAAGRSGELVEHMRPIEHRSMVPVRRKRPGGPSLRMRR